MIELSWSAPDSCPSAHVVEQRVERILNRPLASEQQVLIATAVVTPPREGKPWTVTLDSTGGQGRASRTLEAASCDELASATAVFLAILIEPEPSTPKRAEPQRETNPQPIAPVAAKLPPAKTQREAPSFALGMTASVRSASLPTWATGGGMHAALSWRAWRAGVGVSGWLPVDATLGGSANQGAKLQLSSGYAKLCWQIGRAAVVPAACSGAEVVLLRGHGFGPHVEPQSAKAIFGAVQAGGLLRLRSAARLSLVLEGDVVVPIGDRKVVLAGDAPAEIYEPSWGLRLACGAEWEF